MVICDIIICTKDRFNELMQFISSLLSQSLLPNNLIVVDASTVNKGIENECKRLLIRERINLIYINSQPGLTRQRNLGYKYIGSETEVVFYFDDDVILPDTRYIEKILIRYSKDIYHQIGCIFGRIENLPKHPTKPQINAFPKAVGHILFRKALGILSRLFLISSGKTYHILPSGMNVSNQHKTYQECFVKWQPGCCMSFRKEVLNKYLFDETLMGYSMREDLDMSYRVAGEYKILYLPGASLLHSESSTERLDAVKFGEADLRSWHWFVKKNMPSLTNQICFYWGAFGYLLLLLLRFLLYKNNTYHMRAVGGVRALLGIMGYPVIHER